MRQLRLGSAERLQGLATGVAVATVLVLAAALTPLTKLQLGDAGWQLLLHDAGAGFWPLAAVAAAGTALILAYILWLEHRPGASPLLLVFPCGLALAGAIAGAIGAYDAGTTGPTDSSARLAQIAASLALPAWALILSAGLAAGASVALGARELARGQAVSFPWMSLLATLFGITLINTWALHSRMPYRPLTAALAAVALLGPLLAGAAWQHRDPPQRDDDGLALTLCALAAIAAALAAAGADALIQRAAALYAQGPGQEAHHHAEAYGGARGTTLRLAAAAVVIIAVGTGLTVALWRARYKLRPPAGRASRLLAVALFLLALPLLGAATHRYVIGRAVHHANRADSAAPSPGAEAPRPPSPSAQP